MTYKEAPLNTPLENPKKGSSIYIIIEKRNDVFICLIYAYNKWKLMKEHVSSWKDGFYVYKHLEEIEYYLYDNYEPIIALFRWGIEK